VGEKTGKLEETFLYLGEFFKEEVDDTAKNFTTVLEPLLLLFIGLIVAFVALAIISPIYSLTSSVHR
jgi:type IV pilus assembly protein PilC